jgi:hypothetical protein
MAILVEFELVREDEEQVEYTFGQDGRLDRRLVIDKRNEQARPADDRRDISYSGALRKIFEGRQRLGRWPQRGVYTA